ncbi:hypothetical protein B0T19DRAFT_417475 [Cercophora scortea]|uniref:Uncharacterized protein n=1 Tax=Cercophora scortea TaxID=314031 RepID=A0AAE0MIT1_9PEZI|nr:hypothetical protein B0T19DRAFT_417475 [Cercophora scortea]
MREIFFSFSSFGLGAAKILLGICMALHGSGNPGGSRMSYVFRYPPFYIIKILPALFGAAHEFAKCCSVFRRDILSLG